MTGWRDGPGLTSAKCDGMMHDPTHLFRWMWATESWAKQRADGPKCWETDRLDAAKRQEPQAYFDSVLAGDGCDMNWFEGNWGQLGRKEYRAAFTQDAPALLGFDDSIDAFCADRAPYISKEWHRAPRCVSANLNIFSLYSDRVPFNICRTLEWQTCAAKGRIPGQLNRGILFAKAPNQLDPTGQRGKPLGKCSGWLPPKPPEGGLYGYTSDDIFFLEVCLYNQLCSNSRDLFDLTVGDVFICNFSIDRFMELQELLLQSKEEPEEVVECPGA